MYYSTLPYVVVYGNILPYFVICCSFTKHEPCLHATHHLPQNAQKCSKVRPCFRHNQPNMLTWRLRMVSSSHCHGAPIFCLLGIFSLCMRPVKWNRVEAVFFLLCRPLSFQDKEAQGTKHHQDIQGRPLVVHTFSKGFSVSKMGP